MLSPIGATSAQSYGVTSGGVGMRGCRWLARAAQEGHDEGLGDFKPQCRIRVRHVALSADGQSPLAGDLRERRGFRGQCDTDRRGAGPAPAHHLHSLLFVVAENCKHYKQSRANPVVIERPSRGLIHSLF